MRPALRKRIAVEDAAGHRKSSVLKRLCPGQTAATLSAGLAARADLLEQEAVTNLTSSACSAGESRSANREQLVFFQISGRNSRRTSGASKRLYLVWCSLRFADDSFLLAARRVTASDHARCALSARSHLDIWIYNFTIV